MSVEVKLSRMDRVYHPGQILKGVVIVHGRGAPLQHDGISLVAEGSAALQLSAKSVGLFEAFYSSIKPVQLLVHSRELQPAGKLPADATEFAFEFELQPVAGEKLHESYHGVFVNLQYVITVEVRRGMLAKNLKRSIEFIVEAPEARQHKESPATFSIVPESLENVRKSALHQVPNFKIRGQLDSVVCNIAQPLTGEVCIEECSATIRSIELQLVRVETCSYQDGLAREATEIQNIQIADGPVCHGWSVPVHMIFPRLFTCPTISTRTFKVDFEVNLVVLFSDGHLLTENFPLKLVRTAEAAPKPTDDEAASAAPAPAAKPTSAPAATPTPLPKAAAATPRAESAPPPPKPPPPKPSPPKPPPQKDLDDDPLSGMGGGSSTSDPLLASLLGEPAASAVDPVDASDPLGDSNNDTDPLSAGDPLGAA